MFSRTKRKAISPRNQLIFFVFFDFLVVDFLDFFPFPFDSTNSDDAFIFVWVRAGKIVFWIEISFFSFCALFSLFLYDRQFCIFDFSRFSAIPQLGASFSHLCLQQGRMSKRSANWLVFCDFSRVGGVGLFLVKILQKNKKKKKKKK
jgi:hypothetical protein